MNKGLTGLEQHEDAELMTDFPFWVSYPFNIIQMWQAIQHIITHIWNNPEALLNLNQLKAFNWI